MIFLKIMKFYLHIFLKFTDNFKLVIFFLFEKFFQFTNIFKIHGYFFNSQKCF